MMTQLIMLASLFAGDPTPSADARTGPHPVAVRGRPSRAESPPVYVSAADLLLVSERTDEGTLIVDVFVARASDLRGHQVAVRPQVERDSQSWTLLEVRIDDSRADFVFAGAEHFNATDLRGAGRLAAVLANGGVDVDAPRYLGTFVYRVPDLLEGDAKVELLAADTLLRDSTGAAIEPRIITPLAEIPMSPLPPAVDGSTLKTDDHQK